MARSTRRNVADTQAGEVSAYDLAIVVQALTGQSVSTTDTDTVEHPGTEHAPHDTDPSTSSAPPNERRHRK
jgi:hypothetical protein